MGGFGSSSPLRLPEKPLSQWFIHVAGKLVWLLMGCFIHLLVGLSTGLCACPHDAMAALPWGKQRKRPRQRLQCFMT